MTSVAPSGPASCRRAGELRTFAAVVERRQPGPWRACQALARCIHARPGNSTLACSALSPAQLAAPVARLRPLRVAAELRPLTDVVEFEQQAQQAAVVCLPLHLPQQRVAAAAGGGGVGRGGGQVDLGQGGWAARFGSGGPDKATAACAGPALQRCSCSNSGRHAAGPAMQCSALLLLLPAPGLPVEGGGVQLVHNSVAQRAQQGAPAGKPAACRARGGEAHAARRRAARGGGKRARHLARQQACRGAGMPADRAGAAHPPRRPAGRPQRGRTRGRNEL